MNRSDKIKQAVILAGGKGRRLLPYTKILPKPLWPVGDLPIVEILLRQLSNNGISDVVMAVGHQSKLIQTVIGDGSQYKLKIRYIEEKTPLGTTGPLKKIPRLDSNFLVLNGDILTDMNFSKFSRQHVSSGSIATISAFERKLNTEFGVIETIGDKIVKYREKPKIKYTVSGGIYAFSKEILSFIPNKKFDFPDLVKKLIKSNRNPSVYRFKGEWFDIGRLNDWEAADKLFQKKKNLFLK